MVISKKAGSAERRGQSFRIHVSILNSACIDTVFFGNFQDFVPTLTKSVFGFEFITDSSIQFSAKSANEGLENQANDALPDFLRCVIPFNPVAGVGSPKIRRALCE